MRRALVAALLLSAACYRPKIPDGAFMCGPGGLCPDGYVCNTLMMCAKPGGGADLAGGDDTLFSGKVGALELAGTTGTLKVSTKTGEITIDDGVMVTSIFPPSVDGFTIVNQNGGPPVAVWAFSRVDIPATVTVRPTSESEAIPVFATMNDLTMSGTMDWRTFGGFGNLKGMPGSSKMSGVDSGGGAGGPSGGGGGGGGYSDVGVMGMGTDGGTGGQSYGTPDLMPVHTGSGGGGGGDNGGGRGGNGGGAVVLIAAGALTVEGKIDVSGSNGVPGGPLPGGGGGGGSGGSIFLSGMTVPLNTGHELVARGGPGGAPHGTGSPGGDGAAGRIWIGGQISASGGVVADPMETQSATPVGTFPAP